STFAPLFAAGFLGQSRRVVTYPAHLQFINDWVSVSAFVLGISMLVFLYNFVYSLLFARIKAPANPWSSLSLEWQLPSPVPLNNDHLWRPKHVDPSLTLGTLVMALTVASALLVRLGLVDHRAGRRPQWRLKGVAALALGLIVIVLQFVEWTTANFGPADGGYA